VTEEVKAEKHLVQPHHIAAAKPRQEGFAAKDEDAITLNISSTDYISGGTAIHTESKTRATRKEKQSGVRETIF
jgi:hypothetical protein